MPNVSAIDAVKFLRIYIVWREYLFKKELYVNTRQSITLKYAKHVHYVWKYRNSPIPSNISGQRSFRIKINGDFNSWYAARRHNIQELQSE